MDMKLLLPICTLILWTCVSGGPGSGCTTDQDCTDPVRKKRGGGSFRPYCETVSGECVECLVDAACAAVDPGRPFCMPGITRCVECLDNSDCDEPAPICFDGDCRNECMDGTNCEDNEKCDIARGLCVCQNDDDTCNDDSESCDEDGNCSCDLGFVRESENSDFCISDCNPPCGEGEVCRRDGTCECGPTTVRGPSEECVPCKPDCSTNSDCDNKGEVCNSQFECECPPMEKLFRGKCVKSGRLGGWCKSGGKCKGRMLKCNRSTNMCMCRGRHCEARTVCVKRRI